VSYTVTALDPFGQHRHQLRGHGSFLTTMIQQASLPADYLFVPGDNGKHTFFVVLRTAARTHHGHRHFHGSMTA